MDEVRYLAAGAHHASLGFLVSGGKDGSARLSSSELSSDGATWGAYTQLPIEVNSHCLVALDRDDGDFFLTGGSSGGTLKRAFIHRTNSWVEVTAMPTARYGKKSK